MLLSLAGTVGPPRAGFSLGQRGVMILSRASRASSFSSANVRRVADAGHSLILAIVSRCESISFERNGRRGREAARFGGCARRRQLRLLRRRWGRWRRWRLRLPAALHLRYPQTQASSLLVSWGNGSSLEGGTRRTGATLATTTGSRASRPPSPPTIPTGAAGARHRAGAVATGSRRARPPSQVTLPLPARVGALEGDWDGREEWCQGLGSSGRA